MIILAGSILVRDSEGIQDLDVVYLTPSINKYILLLRLKDNIERMLHRKLNIKVTFSPYLILSPTLVGNLFLAITMLRYPYRKRCMNCLVKLTLARHDVRWLVLHLIYALLGIISSKNCRDYKKYCSMLAENLLYQYGVEIPDTWGRTVKLGCALSSRLGLQRIHLLLKSCLKYICNKCNLHGLDREVLYAAVLEYMNKVVGGNVTKTVSGLGNALRRLHEAIMTLLFKRRVRWVRCSSMLLIAATPEVLSKMLIDENIKKLIISVFDMCRYEISVLSPLAHP